MRVLVETSAVAVATALCYLTFLGWDQTKDRDPSTGMLSGPYNAWQVIGCASALLALGIWAVSGRHPAIVAAVPAVLTACWILDAVRDESDQGLWPIGAASVACGSTVVAVALWGVAPQVRMLLSPPDRRCWTQELWQRNQHRLPLVLSGSTAIGAFAGLALGALAGHHWAGAASLGALTFIAHGLLLLSGRSVAIH